jgi:predicted small secreted protein
MKNTILQSMRIFSALIAAFCCLFVSGCNTVDSVQPGKGQKFTVAARSYDQLWKAAVTVVSRQLTIVEESKTAGSLKAESKAGVTTHGEVVGVFIHPAGVNAGSYEIEVVSLKRDAIQITGQDWTNTIIAGIKAELQ